MLNIHANIEYTVCICQMLNIHADIDYNYSYVK